MISATTPLSMLLCLSAAAVGASMIDADMTGRELAGSRWRLTSIQSPDVAQTAVMPPESGHYTLAFNRDGHAVIETECSSATASWSSWRFGRGSGMLQLGAPTTSGKPCALSNLGENIDRDLGTVRSYQVVGEQLRLRLDQPGVVLVLETVAG